MKKIKKSCYAIGILLLIGCGQNAGKTGNSTPTNTSSQPGEAASANGIVGEWLQQYTYFDKNGNYTLEPEERTPSNTRLGFDWFKFNADGSCLRDKEMKFKSTYEIQEKGDSRKLMIQNVHGYTITELTANELILGAEGAFIVFKKIG